jgi:hypothetical protein
MDGSALKAKGKSVKKALYLDTWDKNTCKYLESKIFALACLQHVIVKGDL